jgi:hypothetical protein
MANPAGKPPGEDSKRYYSAYEEPKQSTQDVGKTEAGGRGRPRQSTDGERRSARPLAVA